MVLLLYVVTKWWGRWFTPSFEDKNPSFHPWYQFTKPLMMATFPHLTSFVSKTSKHTYIWITHLGRKWCKTGHWQIYYILLLYISQWSVIWLVSWIIRWSQQNQFQSTISYSRLSTLPCGEVLDQLDSTTCDFHVYSALHVTFQNSTYYFVHSTIWSLEHD